MREGSMSDDEPFADVDWDDIKQPANPLPLIQQWYLRQCDGDWEHRYGVQIQSGENPGWWVKIDVAGTALAGKPFAKVLESIAPDRQSHGDRWVRCELVDSVWNGAGGAKSLNRILLTFLNWAADVDPGWPGKPKRSP